MACFRDRYFTILAYLLTVLADILRVSAIAACAKLCDFRLRIASQSSQLTFTEPAGLPPPLETLPPLAPCLACHSLKPAALKFLCVHRATLLAVALISLCGNGSLNAFFIITLSPG